MADPIDREAFVIKIKNKIDTLLREDSSNLEYVVGRSLNYAIQLCKEMPSVDAVKKKHGHWIVHHYLDTELECSECQYVRVFERVDLPKEDYPTYCEQCGAEMNEEVKQFR